MNKRIANGVPMNGTNVIALDVAALLAGVSFGNTLKVMLGLIAIHKSTGISYQDMLDYDSLPLQLASTDDRLSATERFVAKVVASPELHETDLPLHLGHRFDQNGFKIHRKVSRSTRISRS